MIWNYNQRPHQALLVLFIFAVLIIILLFVAQKSYPGELEVTTSLALGMSSAFNRPFVDMQLGANAYGFMIYGGARIDNKALFDKDIDRPHIPSFGPMRSVYDIGFKFNWRFIELGWYHQCTHRGDYATHEQWYQMRKPTENDYYIKFSFTR